jgi:hypothetical protein
VVDDAGGRRVGVHEGAGGDGRQHREDGNQRRTRDAGCVRRIGDTGLRAHALRQPVGDSALSLDCRVEGFCGVSTSAVVAWDRDPIACGCGRLLPMQQFVPVVRADSGSVCAVAPVAVVLDATRQPDRSLTSVHPRRSIHATKCLLLYCKCVYDWIVFAIHFQ